ncbi:MAG: hypothetical protein BAA03_12875 [Caldibacillus debilis]|nr:MAG: hypothetical protein BAA03_12875 [Caldibacillus debilis]
MIKRTGWKAAVPAEGLVTVPFLFRVGEYWRRRETAPSRRKIAASSTGLRLVPFHFGRMRERAQAFRKGYLPFVAGIFVLGDDARNIC